MGISSQDIVRENIKKLRSKSHLTQEDLAERTGLSTSFIARIENGTVGVSLNTIDTLSKALQVCSFELFLDEASSEIFENYEYSELAQKVQEVVENYMPKRSPRKRKS